MNNAKVKHDGEYIKYVRKLAIARARTGQYEDPIRPCRAFRMAISPTKSPYDYVRKKKRRKIAKKSRKINRA